MMENDEILSNVILNAFQQRTRRLETANHKEDHDGGGGTTAAAGGNNNSNHNANSSSTGHGEQNNDSANDGQAGAEDEDSESDFEDFDGAKGSPIDWDEILSSTLSQVSFDIISAQLQKHQVFGRILGLENEPKSRGSGGGGGGASLMKIFTTTCVLCDKLTKPSNNDTFNISLDLTSDLLILFTYDFNSMMPEFDLSFSFAKIIEAIIDLLKISNSKFDDAALDAHFVKREKVLSNGEEIVRHAKNLLIDCATKLENSRQKKKKKKGSNVNASSSFRADMDIPELIDEIYAKYSNNTKDAGAKNKNNAKTTEILKKYATEISKLPIYQESFYEDWLPLNLSHMNLELLYSVLAVLIYSIFKLFKQQTNNNLYYNPFLKFFIQLWKLFTRVMMLGIQIDRLDEEIYGLGTPWVVRSILKGSAAIRSVLATILNQDTQRREHDLKHESLNNFMAPFGRKAGDGALIIDLRIYVAALVVLGHDLNKIGELFINTETNDRYDEDIWYMFEYEFTTDDEYEDEEDEEEDENDDDDENGDHKHKNVYIKKEYTARCYCEFDDQDSEGEEDNIDLQIAEEERAAKGIASAKNNNTIASAAQTKGGPSFNDSSNNIKEDNTAQDNAPKARENLMLGVRSKNELEFDSLGRDWRDIPRGDNVFFNTDNDLQRIRALEVKFSDGHFSPNDKKRELEEDEEKEDDDDDEDYDLEGEHELYELFTSWEELRQTFITMALRSVPYYLQRRAISTISYAVNAEYEKEIEDAALDLDPTKEVIYDEKSLDKKLSQLSLNSDSEKKDSKTIRKEQNHSGKCKEASESENDEINPDKIYEMWSYVWIFEPILRSNPLVACAMMDEMLMAKGYRRALIWLMTHLELSHTLINYIHELSIGKRGTSQSSLKFPLSRNGRLVLTDIEKSMLLHEFFSNASVYLSTASEDNDDQATTLNASGSSQDLSMRTNLISNNTNGRHGEFDGETEQGFRYLKNFQSAKKIMEIICLMIKSLVEKKVIKLADDDYKTELQSLLIRWIGTLPEARALYFATKVIDIDQDNDSGDEDEESMSTSKFVKDKARLNQKLSNNIMGTKSRGNFSSENIDSYLNDINGQNVDDSGADLKALGNLEASSKKGTFFHNHIKIVVNEISQQDSVPEAAKINRFGNGFSKQFIN